MLDLSSCVEEVSIKLQKKAQEDEGTREAIEREGLEKIARNACLLIEGAKKWEEATSEFKRRGLYTEGDARPLNSVILAKEGTIEMTVGSSPGHRTRVNLNKMELRYYDTDRDVNWVMKKLFEEVGAKCEDDDEGVFCDISGLSEEDIINRLFPRIAAATSMDIRMNNRGDDWKESEPEIYDKCSDLSEREDFELCAVRELLKKIGSY